MDDEPVIGIDLGTTNSEVAIVSGGKPIVVKEDDEAIVPSCVGLDEAGNVIVGRRARNQATAAPERTVLSVKRLMGSDTRVRMGDEEYTPQEISAFILKALKDRAARALGRDVCKAVITVPAYFTDAQRQATREAGTIAGLEVVRIINEPTAAALSYEARGGEGQRRILVYDLGGGTFDVSVVGVEAGVVEVLASTGDNRLGGDDFDALLVERLNAWLEAETGAGEGAREDRLLQARLQRAAERAKIELSGQPFTLVEEDHVASVRGETRHLSCEIAREEFERDVEEMLARTMRAVTTALTDANVRPSQLDRILLVGGSTRIPRIAQLLAERLGQEPHGGVDPDLCVALGAGVQAGIEMGLDMEAVLVDITPYTFGTSTVGELYGRPYAHQFVPLIRRNSKLPITRTDVFFTLFEEQESVEIKVYQGEDPDALENVEIGTFLFSGLNRERGAHEHGLLFTYSLDLDGLLHVHARERTTGRELHGVVENALGRSSTDELGASRARITSLWGDEDAGSGPGPGSDGTDPGDAGSGGGEAKPAGTADAGPPTASEGYRDTLERAEKALDTAPAEDREELVDLMEDLRESLMEGQLERAAEIKQELDEILFYLE